MTWEIAAYFAIWIAALAVALLIVLFCACGVVALWENIVDIRSRAISHLERQLAEECAIRKNQNQEIRKRLHDLERSVTQQSTT